MRAMRIMGMMGVMGGADMRREPLCAAGAALSVG